MANLFPDELVEPGETQTTVPERLPRPRNGSPGLLLTVSNSAGEALDESDIAFSLRVKDLSRAALSAGTQVPVVRERDLRSGTAILPHVPVAPRFRTLLRIYNVDRDEASYLVRVLSPDGAVLSERSVAARTSWRQGPVRVEPAYAEVPNVLDGLTAEFVTVEVRPLTIESGKFWTFLSITNNESHEFTTVSPQ